MEFYDFALHQQSDFLLILDADAFLFDGDWVARYLKAFDDPDVAAVSFVPRKGAPAIYALLCRTADYLALESPVFPSRYKSPQHWPRVADMQPGDYAAERLLTLGKKIINVDERESERHVANFHGTTALRICRSLIGNAIGKCQFEDLVKRERYYMVGAYDNALLGSLYELIFQEPFAPDASGRSLGSSMTIPDLQRLLNEIESADHRKLLASWFGRSNKAILEMAKKESLNFVLPEIVPPGWL